MNRKKKLFSLLLVVAMIVTAVSTNVFNAFAEESVDNITEENNQLSITLTKKDGSVLGGDNSASISNGDDVIINLNFKILQDNVGKPKLCIDLSKLAYIKDLIGGTCFTSDNSNVGQFTVDRDTVYIEYDEGDKTDKYDRHLGYLWYYSKDDSNWQMFNETLISEGYARVGYIYSQKRHLDEFYKAQDYAKSNKLNIWSVDGYVTDKGFDVDAYNSNKNTSSNSSSSSNNIVYANGGSSSSNKYHSTKDAHNMKGAVKMTEKEAKSKGYVPCGICY